MYMEKLMEKLKKISESSINSEKGSLLSLKSDKINELIGENSKEFNEDINNIKGNDDFNYLENDENDSDSDSIGEKISREKIINESELLLKSKMDMKILIKRIKS